jgi:hypothetical protein
MMPAGICAGAMAVLPITSGRTTVQAPIRAATGSTLVCRTPTRVRAACGATRPTKAFTPTDDTAPSVSSTATESSTSREPGSHPQREGGIVVDRYQVKIAAQAGQHRQR